MSTFISMMVASRRSTLDLVKTSVESVCKNIGDPNYKLFIGKAPYVDASIHEYLQNDINPEFNVEVRDYAGSFAQFVNLAANMASRDGYEYVIESHDDVEILSDNLVPRVQDVLSKTECQIGWISFLDKDYLNGSWAPSIREGFALDAMTENAWSRKKVHQFHTLPENWWSLDNSRKRLESFSYDIPKAPVKCHAPFSHFIMIRTKTLVEQIGECPDWSPVSLLIDEDRGLKALSRGLFNIWIPQIEYVHRRPSGTRAWELIRMFSATAHKSFTSKWGFPHKPTYSDSEIQSIDKKYSGTNVCWSVGKRTYEWEYII